MRAKKDCYARRSSRAAPAPCTLPSLCSTSKPKLNGIDVRKVESLAGRQALIPIAALSDALVEPQGRRINKKDEGRGTTVGALEMPCSRNLRIPNEDGWMWAENPDARLENRAIEREPEVRIPPLRPSSLRIQNLPATVEKIRRIGGLSQIIGSRRGSFRSPSPRFSWKSLKAKSGRVTFETRPPAWVAGVVGELS